MRRPALFVLVVLCAGCGKKADPAPEVTPNLGGVAVTPVGRGDEPFAGKSVREWEAELRSADPERVALAACAAYGLGPDAVPLTPALLDISRTAEINTSPVFQRMGPGCVPTLVTRLNSPDTSVRSRAALLLGFLKFAPDLAVPALTAALSDAEVRVRRVAATALGQFGQASAPALVSLKKLLSDTDLKTQLAAACAVAQLDPVTVEHVPILIETGIKGIVWEAGDAGYDSIAVAWDKRCVPALVGRMRKQPLRRETLLELATRIGPDGAPVLVETIRECTSFTKPWNPRYSYISEWFEKAGSKANAVAPDLLTLAKTDRTEVRALAIWALVAVREKSVVPVARDVLKNAAIPAHAAERQAAMEALIAFDDAGVLPEARKVLEAAAGSPNLFHYNNNLPSVEVACRAVARYPAEADKVVPTLLVLASNAPPFTTAVAALARLAPDETVSYPFWCRQYTGHIGTFVSTDFDAMVAAAGRKPIPHLEKLLASPEPEIAAGAALALCRYGPPNDASMEVLNTNVFDGMWANHRMFVGLKSMGSLCLPVLTAWLAHPQSAVRAMAAYSLGEMGSVAAPAGAEIAARLAKEDNPRVMASLVDALGKISPASNAEAFARVLGVEADPGIKIAALGALERAGAPAKVHSLAVQDALRSPHVGVKFAAIRTLTAIDPKAAVLPQACLDLRRDLEVRAKTEIVYIPKPGDPSVSALVTILYDIAPEAAVSAGIKTDLIDQSRPPR